MAVSGDQLRARQGAQGEARSVTRRLVWPIMGTAFVPNWGFAEAPQREVWLTPPCYALARMWWDKTPAACFLIRGICVKLKADSVSRYLRSLQQEFEMPLGGLF